MPSPDGFHCITEREDGPDLQDMIRLVEFLRSSRVEHYNIGSVHRGEDGPEQCRMTVSWWTLDRRPGAKHAATIGGEVEERHPLPEAFFVDLDGMTFDANLEALS